MWNSNTRFLSSFTISMWRAVERRRLVERGVAIQ
jgi:hypothetical protein